MIKEKLSDVSCLSNASDFRSSVAFWQHPRSLPFVPLVRMTCGCRTICRTVGIIWTEENRNTRSKTSVMPLFAQQMSHGLSWDRTRTCTVRTVAGLKTKIIVNYISRQLVPRSELPLCYKKKVNDLQWNNCCSYWRSIQIHKFTLCAEHKIL
jgi:hypothetical protein